jgi:hypothetical protein
MRPDAKLGPARPAQDMRRLPDDPGGTSRAWPGSGLEQRGGDESR